MRSDMRLCWGSEWKTRRLCYTHEIRWYLWVHRMLYREQGAQGKMLWEGDFWRRVIKRQALATSCSCCIIASRKDVSEDRLWKCILWNKEEQQQPIPVVCIDTFSEKGKQLALRLQGKIVFNLAYMTTKRVVPKACFDKWFGATAVEIG